MCLEVLFKSGNGGDRANVCRHLVPWVRVGKRKRSGTKRRAYSRRVVSNCALSADEIGRQVETHAASCQISTAERDHIPLHA